MPFDLKGKQGRSFRSLRMLCGFSALTFVFLLLPPSHIAHLASLDNVPFTADPHIHPPRIFPKAVYASLRLAERNSAVGPFPWPRDSRLSSPLRGPLIRLAFPSGAIRTQPLNHAAALPKAAAPRPLRILWPAHQGHRCNDQRRQRRRLRTGHARGAGSRSSTVVVVSCVCGVASCLPACLSVCEGGAATHAVAIRQAPEAGQSNPFGGVHGKRNTARGNALPMLSS
jgi:hypothetical protein